MLFGTSPCINCEVRINSILKLCGTVCGVYQFQCSVELCASLVSINCSVKNYVLEGTAVLRIKC